MVEIGAIYRLYGSMCLCVCLYGSFEKSSVSYCSRL